MPVHISDMKSLPDILSENTNKFSTMPFDPGHEQENKIVKGSNGVIGLTVNPDAVRRWMLSEPEMARLLKQFEEEYIPDEETGMHEYCQHHEQGL